LLGLLFVHADSSSATDDTPAVVLELLTTFSGEDAQQYEPYFRYADDASIVSVEVHAVGTEITTGQDTSDEEAWDEVNNILRIMTADGFEEDSGVATDYQGGFSDEHFRALKGIAGVFSTESTPDGLYWYMAPGPVARGSVETTSTDTTVWAWVPGQPAWRCHAGTQQCREA
jgi:hypothetical protein